MKLAQIRKFLSNWIAGERSGMERGCSGGDIPIWPLWRHLWSRGVSYNRSSLTPGYSTFKDESCNSEEELGTTRGEPYAESARGSTRCRCYSIIQDQTREGEWKTQAWRRPGNKVSVPTKSRPRRTKEEADCELQRGKVNNTESELKRKKHHLMLPKELPLMHNLSLDDLRSDAEPYTQEKSSRRSSPFAQPAR